MCYDSTEAWLLFIPQCSTRRMTTCKQYDYLNRLTDITSWVGTPGSYVRGVSFVYQYKKVNQLVCLTLLDALYWLYKYD
jgi:hypothetical protein